MTSWGVEQAFDRCEESLVNGSFDRGSAGWVYHGGGGAGTIFGGTLRLVSMFQIGGTNGPLTVDRSWRRHGNFVLPDDASSIRYRYRVLRPGTLRVSLIRLPDHVVVQSTTESVSRSGWVDGVLILPAAIEQGSTGAFTVEIQAFDGLSVMLDDFRFVGCSQ
jgi:hypothetical protein